MSTRLRKFACISAVVASLALVGAAPPPGAVHQRRVAELIAKLGDDDFDARERASNELKRLGSPCLPALTRALEAKDLEVRKRARRLLGEIDPGFLKREARRVRQAETTKFIELKRGTDATTWGESITNPFTALTAEGKKQLRAEGIDAERLLKMRARLIVGTYGGANSKTFVNRDADTILVFGKGFVTHGSIHSVGPVLAMEDAYFMSSLQGASVVWFVDKSSSSQRVSAAPLLVSTSRPFHREIAADGDVLAGDFGWKAPADLCKPLLEATKNDPAATKDLAAERKKIAAQMKDQRDEGAKDRGRAVANPFTNLTDEGKKKLKARGIDVDRLSKLKKCLYVDGRVKDTLVNSDSDTILVLGEAFFTMDNVYSLGPVVALGKAHFMSQVTGADLVWFVDKSFPRGTTTGAPVILAPTASRSQMREGNKHVWHGDYGWQRPKGWPGDTKGKE